MNDPDPMTPQAQPTAAPDMEHLHLALNLAEAFAGRRWVALLQAERTNAAAIPRRVLRLEAERAADDVLLWRDKIAASQADPNRNTHQQKEIHP
jgi:hypothetical protein